MLIDMVLKLNQYIPGIPGGRKTAWSHATRNDETTLTSWRDVWINQTIENSKTHDFSKSSAMDVFGECSGQPCILMGAGPSLQKNWKELVGDGKTSHGRRDIPIITSVHNFAFCEERDLMKATDFYMILDAGDICIKEMYEGGKHDQDWYWERTKNRVLVAYHGTHPEFIKKWRGVILWYGTPFASPDLAAEITKIVDVSKVPTMNVGGNVMGAALYFARAILGCSVPIFIGMDLCFSYAQKFHPWECQYNKQFSGVIPWVDIWGNKVWTWPSYFGFKNWFDFVACGGTGNNAHIWINATEGGIMGSYAEGNIQQIIQLDLKTALHIFNAHRLLPGLVQNSTVKQLNLLF